MAIEARLDGAGGYDDNPAVTDQATMGRRPTAAGEPIPGTGFFTISGDLSHTFSSESGIELETAAGGVNTSYYGEGSKNQVNSSITLSIPFMDGIVLSSLFAGGNIYRDYLVQYNSLDEFLTGIRLDVSAWAKADVSFDLTCHWLNYREKIKVGMSHDRPAGKKRGHFRPPNALDRDDFLLETGMAAWFYLAPRLTLETRAGYARQDSSINLFSWNQMAISAGFTSEPFEKIIFSTYATCFQTWYDKVPKDSDSHDSSWTVDLKLARRLAVFEIYATFSWQENITVAGGENGSRHVTSGGISWSF